MRRHPSQIRELIIHCAATPNGKHFTSEQIDAWHAQRGFRRNMADFPHHEPGLKHIGYHYVIYANGAVRCGRNELEVGAHCQGHNTAAIGTCLVGTDQFSAAQWESLAKHVDAIRKRFPTIHVHGHREFSNKICPGFDVQAWLTGDMRALAGHLLAEPS
ncbi:MAG: N-acetylmuramoyl-L-alanine amidase [Methylotetracoccus sp.]